MPPHDEKNSARAPFNKAEGGFLLSSGFQKYPSKRENFLQNSEIWLRGKREDDGVYPYWRVHDKLYDLTDFVSSHPGGKFWLEATQGTDITESFETSHIGNNPKEVMKKYFVKDISEPRNSPFTFNEDGFYKTLKRKVDPILKEAGIGPTMEMFIIQDGFLYGFLYSLLLASMFNSVTLILVSSVFLSLAVIASHNFIHQKDNWRMYIFDLMFQSSKDWRISHVISHHNFANTIYDYEISSFEPFLDILPRVKKSFIFRYGGAYVISYFVFALAFHVDLLKKIILILKGDIKLRWENGIPVLQLLLMMAINGSPKQALWLWLAMHTVSNFVFLGIALTASHNHPEIYREGDAAPEDKDWGVYQIVSIRDRREAASSLFLVTVFFGNHTLHHLFPTVDYSKLPLLMPSLLETCKEFGIQFEVFTMWQLFKGFFHVQTSAVPNPNPPKCFQKKEN